MPTTAGTSTISDEFLLLDKLAVVSSTDALLFFAVLLPFPTSFITTNIVIIRIMTAIPIPIHFITSSSLSFLSSSISSSSESLSNRSSSDSLSASSFAPSVRSSSSSSSGSSLVSESVS